MDKALSAAIQRANSNEESLLQLAQPTLEAVAAPATGSAYGLDRSGDFDIASIEPSQIAAVQEQLAEDPEGVVAAARQLWDCELTAEELHDALEQTKRFVERPKQAVGVLESTQAFESAVAMPANFGFEGYDPQHLPVVPMDTKYETVADALGYAATFVAAKAANVLKPKHDFFRHGPNRSFVYDLPSAPTRLGVLADFGNGLVHSRYIARHVRTSNLDHLLYLGDVYYTGTAREFERNVAPEIEPLLSGAIPGNKKVAVWMLNSNHEMFSKGYGYFSYLKYRLAKGAPQRQEGSYFALRFGKSVQIIAIDTDYFGYRKFRDANQIAWLRQRLAEGRANGAINILLSANEPFSYGKNSLTPLYDDLKPYLSSIDLWLWGNTHYCGLFDSTSTLPVSSCLGHGGYPYRLSEYDLDRQPYLAPCPATPLFLETKTRYDGTNLRPELGNNGYAILTVDPVNATLTLEYLDWMKRPRYRATLGRAQDGRLGVLKGEEL